MELVHTHAGPPGLRCGVTANMPVKRDEMLDVLCMVSKEENLRVTLKHSAKGGLITGATAMAAGFLMGPVGLAVASSI